jgi:hypothetical protein|tara:strand:- start:128 stop:301 length:174 start_codon:yes stop_codon:yes gene_type:complete
VQYTVSGASAYQIVAAFVDQPVDDAEEEQDGETKHLVNVEGVAKHDGEEQELEDLLL